MGIPLSGISPQLGVPPIGDKANAVISGQFTGIGVSSAFCFYGAYNVLVYGAAGPNGPWNGTIRLERSFDGGTTWVVCGIGGSGAQASWATASGGDVSVTGSEPEQGVAYRLHCTVYASGTINYRMSCTGVLATSNGISA